MQPGSAHEPIALEQPQTQPEKKDWETPKLKSMSVELTDTGPLLDPYENYPGGTQS